MKSAYFQMWILSCAMLALGACSYSSPNDSVTAAPSAKQVPGTTYSVRFSHGQAKDADRIGRILVTSLGPIDGSRIECAGNDNKGTTSRCTITIHVGSAGDNARVAKFVGPVMKEISSIVPDAIPTYKSYSQG